MSDRERWIVYPLLFLALGVALHDKMTRTIEGVALIGGKQAVVNLDRGYLATRVVEADLIRCQRLVVEQAPNKPLVIIGGVKVPSKDGQQKSSGAISIHGQEGKEIIVLRANNALKGELVRRQKEGEEPEIVFEVKDVKEDGGLLEIFDADKSLSLVLAHHALESGLFAKNSKGQIVRLSRMITHPPTEPAATAKPAPPNERTKASASENPSPPGPAAGQRMKEERTTDDNG
jgi:hypothetical protein